jgi:hypothetical protein
MKLVTRGGAWSNGEVAYLVWNTDAKIDDCLGFMITRVHETGPDAGQRRVLPTWVAFQDQTNPNWNEQDASVWPIQRFDWRDLTLRKSRDTTHVRPIDFDVHYEIVPVGGPAADRTEVPVSATAPAVDANGQPSFEGPQHKLFQIGEPFVTNSIRVTHDYGDADVKISAAFTNGILSTQNLLRQLEAVNKAPPATVLAATRSAHASTRVAAGHAVETHLLSTLKDEIVKPESEIRAFLTGDVYAFLTRLLERAKAEGGEVYLALYELHDPPLIARLRSALQDGFVHLILTTAGNEDPNARDTPKEDRQPIVWDTENDPVRADFHALATGALAGRVIDRMFNTNARIGHNKFAVYVRDGQARAVLSGSTNWTETGLCTQSNNCILVEDAELAGDYWAYWKRLADDHQPDRVPTVTRDAQGEELHGAQGNTAKQGAALRAANAQGQPWRAFGAAGSGRLYASPNTHAATVPEHPDTPPDLEDVYALMRGAREAVLFLSFMPGVSGRNNIIGVAAEISEASPDKLVLGAISDPAAMPPPADGGGGPQTYVDAHGEERKLPPPAIWWPAGDASRIAMIRAAAVRIPYGNLRPELLTAGHAIIHDKIIVIDPLDAENCVVVTGSHNLGYKASYCNDDNLLIIKGNKGLATAYAVHILDLYDHYVFRARLEQNLRGQLAAGKIHSFEDAVGASEPHGLLRTDAGWQDRHFAPRSKGAWDYFLAHANAG